MHQQGNKLTSAPKLRTKRGCKTCRERRIKCDEGKPVCRKCASTNRACGGYGIWGGGNITGTVKANASSLARLPDNKTAAMPRQLSPFPHILTSSEGAAYSHFHSYMATKLPGVFVSQFWEKLVLQASLQESSVLHAVVALAAEQLGNERLLLTSYNQAIAALHKRIHDRPDGYSLRVTLISCLLFTALEFLRGARKAGAVHLRNGFRLLTGLPGAASSHASRCSGSSSRGVESSDACLAETFTRMELQFSVFDQGSDFFWGFGDISNFQSFTFHVTSRFEKVEEARSSLDLIIHAALSISSQVSACITQERFIAIPTTVRRRHKRLLEAVEQWRVSLEASLPGFRLKPNVQTSIAVDLLQAYYSMAQIMVATCLRGRDEMVFDQHQSNFAALLHQIWQLWCRVSTHLTERPSRYSFTLGSGYIPPLYFTALKCRDANLRRVAVDLLAKAPHIEGAWDGTLAAAVARHVIKIEEECLVREPMPPSQVDRSIEGTGLEEPAGCASAIPQASRAQRVMVHLDHVELTKADLRIWQYERVRSSRQWEWKCKVTETSLDLGKHGSPADQQDDRERKYTINDCPVRSLK